MTADPFGLSWTRATIDLFKSSANTGFHVMNHDLSTPAAADRTVRFARARLRWFQRHLPKGAMQGVSLDDRGQDVSDAERARVKAALADLARAGVVFLSAVRS